MMKKSNRFMPSPYGNMESLACLFRIMFGPSKKNPLNTQFIKKKTRLNEIEKKFKIGFIGDILIILGKKLNISSDLADFIKGCDAIVGNLEAPVTNQRRVRYALNHDEKILDALRGIFAPDKFFLSIANNHSADFGEDTCRASAKVLMDNGFQVFGLKETPFIDIQKKIRVWAAAMWSNEPCDYIMEFDDLSGIENINILNKSADNLLFNICYPHWGYELELFPREEIVNKGLSFLKHFDMIIGHHSHVPQPVANYEIDSINKLIAYSLGDFSFWANLKKYIYGEVVTIEIGPDKEGRWLAGNVNWSFTKCVPIGKNELLLSLVDNIPFFSDTQFM
jgi:hypothetical protein